MRPAEFCRQSLEVLRVPPVEAPSAGLEALETLLGCFAADDLSPETFELQLHLLAESEVCSCLAAAATRLLAVWTRQREDLAALAGAGHRN
ncbi:MAG TPA: hypothetical protein VFE37_04960 [Chloroflexota bacterium]|nr:hypothetical protein [Chloroflexota bacterium]